MPVVSVGILPHRDVEIDVEIIKELGNDWYESPKNMFRLGRS
jgi:hypothetical protein